MKWFKEVSFSFLVSPIKKGLGTAYRENINGGLTT
jgi:hypothetical protein